MATSTNKTCRPEARSGGSGWPQWTEPKDRMNVPAEKISEMSAGAQPSMLWQPLLSLLTYRCIRCVQKSPVVCFYMYVCIVICIWLSYPLELLLWCLTHTLFLGKVTCKSRMDNWRKEEELLEWHHLASRFRDLLLCGVQWYVACLGSAVLSQDACSECQVLTFHCAAWLQK